MEKKENLILNEEITKKTWKNILSEQFRKLRG